MSFNNRNRVKISRGKNSSNINRKKHSIKNQNTSYTEQNSKKQKSFPRFSLGEERCLCSFVILNNYNENLVLRSLNIIKESAEVIVVSIPSKNSDIMEKIQNISEEIIIQEYTDECEATLHNRVFYENISDIFIQTNSNIEPRPYSLNILKRYLSQDSVIVTVPTVYNDDSNILHYCIRFPKLISYIKALCGVKSENSRLTMMERGESGYYRIHRVDASKSQLLVINSAALRSTSSKIAVHKEDAPLALRFYKKIFKHGITLFVPTARTIEYDRQSSKCNVLSWLCYILRNVF